jgi:glycosyltransferase involved in cell wall biosynthesis
MLRYTLREAKTVIAVSQALKDAITALAIPGEKVVVVPNGVDATKFYRTQKELSRSMLNLPAGRIILSVGNLTANKGIDLLIQAFSRVASDPLGQDLSLVIVGDGSMRGQLENLIHSMRLSDKVKLVGVVAHEKLNLWYNAADLFCLVSEKEGWPNVLLEALACGVPVVATPVGGIPEVICSDDFGMLTNREQEKIAESIRAAFATTWRADKLSEYAGKFSWDRIARRLQEIFQAVLETENASNNVEPLRDDATARGLITRETPVDSVSEARRINLP